MIPPDQPTLAHPTTQATLIWDGNSSENSRRFLKAVVWSFRGREGFVGWLGHAVMRLG